MQIFLAVAILVYSVVMGTARYELRAEKLNDCGVKLKQLIRELGRELEGRENTHDFLKSIQSKYSDITADTENHTRTDYRLAMLEMKNDFFISGIPRLIEYILAYGSRALAYALPVLMLCIELIFILDMIGVTQILTKYIATNIN